MGAKDVGSMTVRGERRYREILPFLLYRELEKHGLHRKKARTFRMRAFRSYQKVLLVNFDFRRGGSSPAHEWATSLGYSDNHGDVARTSQRSRQRHGYQVLAKEIDIINDVGGRDRDRANCHAYLSGQLAPQSSRVNFK